jgi:hypothetical protein
VYELLEISEYVGGPLDLKETCMTLLQIAYLVLSIGAGLAAVGYLIAFFSVH